MDPRLVLAIDIFLLIDIDEQRLHCDGYVAVLRHPDVIRAIQSGPQDNIALNVYGMGRPFHSDSARALARYREYC